MYVVLVAHDFAASQGLSKLKSALENSGHTVTSFLGFGKDIAANEGMIAEHIRNADVLVLGMSSSILLAKEEVNAAKTAERLHIPYGFYSDTYGNFNHPWLYPLNAKTAFLFVINIQDALEAKRVYGSQTRIIATGNPLWEDFGHPTHTRILTRKLLGITPGQHMILVPGTKDFAVNISLFTNVVEAVKNTGKAVEVYLSPHPGDRNDPRKYTALVKNYPFVHLPSRIAWSGSALVPAADIVIASASTIGIEAAHQRIPVINFFTRLSRRRLQETTGSSSWKPDDLGVSTLVYEDVSMLTREIIWLFSKKGAQTMRKKQELIYPVGKQRGDACRRMIEELRTLPQITYPRSVSDFRKI